MIVQPQDISATLLSIAGVARPVAWVGHDLLEVAASGGSGPRDIALAGPSVVSWRGVPDQIIFTVFDGQWYLNVAADPAACRLFRRGEHDGSPYGYGSVEDVSTAHPEIVARLREAGLQEAACRGTDARLIDWLRSGGAAPFPAECVEWFGPSQWRTYWDHVYAA